MHQFAEHLVTCEKKQAKADQNKRKKEEVETQMKGFMQKWRSSCPPSKKGKVEETNADKDSDNDNFEDDIDNILDE